MLHLDKYILTFLVLSLITACHFSDPSSSLTYGTNGGNGQTASTFGNKDLHVLVEHLKICPVRIRYDNGNRGECGSSQPRSWTKAATYTWSAFDFDGANIFTSPQTFTTNTWGDHFNLTIPTINAALSNNVPPIQHNWTWYNLGKPCHRIWQSIQSDQNATKYGTWELSVSPTNGKPDYEVTVYPEIVSYGTAYISKQSCYDDCGLKTVQYFDAETEITGNIMAYISSELGIALGELQAHYTEESILDDFIPVGERCNQIAESPAPNCNIIVAQLCDDTNNDGNPDENFIQQINICVYEDGSTESVVEYFELAGYGDPDNEQEYVPIKPIVCDVSACSASVVCDAKGNILSQLDCSGSIIFLNADNEIVVPSGNVGDCDNCDLIASEEHCNAEGIVSYIREVTKCGIVFWKDLDNTLLKSRPLDARVCSNIPIVVCESSIFCKNSSSGRFSSSTYPVVFTVQNLVTSVGTYFSSAELITAVNQSELESKLNNLFDGIGLDGSWTIAVNPGTAVGFWSVDFAGFAEIISVQVKSNPISSLFDFTFKGSCEEGLESVSASICNTRDISDPIVSAIIAQDCTRSNTNKVIELLGTNTISFPANSIWSYSYSILEGSLTETTGAISVSGLPSLYSGSSTAGGHCDYLDSKISLRGESVDTRVIIRTME